MDHVHAGLFQCFYNPLNMDHVHAGLFQCFYNPLNMDHVHAGLFQCCHNPLNMDHVHAGLFQCCHNPLNTDMDFQCFHNPLNTDMNHKNTGMDYTIFNMCIIYMILLHMRTHRGPHFILSSEVLLQSLCRILPCRNLGADTEPGTECSPIHVVCMWSFCAQTHRRPRFIVSSERFL